MFLILYYNTEEFTIFTNYFLSLFHFRRHFTRYLIWNFSIANFISIYKNVSSDLILSLLMLLMVVWELFSPFSKVWQESQLWLQTQSASSVNSFQYSNFKYNFDLGYFFNKIFFWFLFSSSTTKMLYILSFTRRCLWISRVYTIYLL